MRSLGKGLNLISALILGAITSLICTDVILRLFRYPIPGSYDITELLTSLMLSLAILRSFQDEAQIKIDLIDRVLKENELNMVNLFSRLVTAFFLAILSISMIYSGLNSYISGEVSMTLRIPLYICYIAIGLNAGIASLNETLPILRIPQEAMTKLPKLGRERI